MSIYDKKPLQYCKVISLQLIKISEKKVVDFELLLACTSVLNYLSDQPRNRGTQVKSRLFQSLLFFIFFFFWLCWVFLAAWAFPQLQQVGATVYFSCCGAQPLVRQGLSGCGSQLYLAHRLTTCGTWALVLRGSGTFPDQGSNLSLLHWQTDSLPLSHQGSPSHEFYENDPISAVLGVKQQ